MLVLAARGGLPSIVERAAGVAVPVAFAALATTSLASQIGADIASLAPVAAVAVGAVAVHRTGSVHAALVAGMPTMWLLSAVLSR
jgi:branched-subunit amino acid transport protein